MYRKGHVGVSLLVFAPVGYVLVSVGETALALVGGAAMVWLAMLPDLDQRVPGLDHRGPTHTVAFALLVGVAAGAAGTLLGRGLGVGERVGLGGFGFFLGTLIVLAHLLADLLTPAGVALFWPLSGRRYSLSLTRADSPVWNYALFVVGVGVAGGVAVLALGGWPAV